MKILAFLASPNGIKGYTGTLLTPMVEAVKAAGADIEVLTSKELKVNFCQGCTKNCHNSFALTRSMKHRRF